MIAKRHIEGVQADAICVIFAYTPAPGEVWLNFAKLLDSPQFTLGARGHRFPAIEAWGRSEKEVILEVPYLTPENVYAWGGFVGSINHLRAVAAFDGDSDQFISEVPELLAQRGVRPGQEWWLPEEKSKEVARRMQAFARERYQHSGALKGSNLDRPL